MERIWNPVDPRIMMPRTWGIGWTINFGAIAVRLGLVRPDDLEEQPFENLSNAAVSAAVAYRSSSGLWPRVLASRSSRGCLRGSQCISLAPVLWGPKTLAIGLPVLVLVWRMVPGLSRGTIAGRWLALLIPTTLAVPAAMFYGLARASLKKEWRAAPAAIKRKEMPR